MKHQTDVFINSLPSQSASLREMGVTLSRDACPLCDGDSCLMLRSEKGDTSLISTFIREHTGRDAGCENCMVKERNRGALGHTHTHRGLRSYSYEDIVLTSAHCVQPDP